MQKQQQPEMFTCYVYTFSKPKPRSMRSSCGRLEELRTLREPMLLISTLIQN